MGLRKSHLNLFLATSMIFMTRRSEGGKPKYIAIIRTSLFFLHQNDAFFILNLYFRTLSRVLLILPFLRWRHLQLRPRVDFTNILQAAFSHADPKSPKKDWRLDCIFYAFGICAHNKNRCWNRSPYVSSDLGMGHTFDHPPKQHGVGVLVWA